MEDDRFVLQNYKKMKITVLQKVFYFVVSLHNGPEG